MRLGQKLTFAGLFMGLLLIGSIAVSLLNLKRVSTSYQRVSQVSFPDVQSLQIIQSAMWRMLMEIQGVGYTNLEEEIEEYHEAEVRLNRILVNFCKTASSNPDAECHCTFHDLSNELRNIAQETWESAEQLEPLLLSFDNLSTRVVHNEGVPRAGELHKSIARLHSMVELSLLTQGFAEKEDEDDHGEDDQEEPAENDEQEEEEEEDESEALEKYHLTITRLIQDIRSELHAATETNASSTWHEDIPPLLAVIMEIMQWQIDRYEIREASEDFEDDLSDAISRSLITHQIELDHNSDQVADILKQSIWVSAIMAGAFLVLMVILQRRLFDRIVCSVTRLTHCTRAVANGDLTTQIDIESNDELGLLAEDFRKMVEAVQEAQSGLEARSLELQKLNSDLQKALAESDRLAQQARAADHAKSLFLANMSHEIRTPMNSILGFAELLNDESLDETQQDYIESINNSATSLLQIVNDVLDYAKMSAGMIHIESGHVPLDRLLKDLDGIHRPLAQKKGLTFDVIQETPLPQYIVGDSARLRQCLLNLVGNAIKFTEKGSVKLTVGMDHTESAGMIQFRIEDTGIGIDTERMGQIFQPFSQIDANYTRAHGGAGLGLTVTQQLIKHMGGELQAQSTPGKGSVFTLHLPVGIDLEKVEMVDHIEFQSNEDRHAANPKTASQSSRPDDESEPFRGHVLIVEDNPTNSKLLGRILSKMGLAVDTTTNGREAVEAVEAERQDQYDLIFMDIQMPVMDGHEATRTLRQNGYRMPIVALTANALKGDDAKCYDAGCDQYLTKPIHRAKIEAVVRDYLCNQPSDSPTYTI